MSEDLTFGVRLDGDSGSLVSSTEAARDGISNLRTSTDELAISYAKLNQEALAAGQAWLKGDAAADNAADKAWALANGYKEVDGQLIKTKGHADEAAGANAGVTRSLITLGREALSGNFAQMPGTMAVLASRAGLTAGEMVSLGVSIGAPVVALGALTIAIYEGRKEMEAMNNALAVTSNYAGLTRSGMESLAASMAASGQITIGTSKEIVTALVASGRIGAEAIGAVAALASDFARATGQDIEKITPELVKLFSDPLKGAEELNKSMHFLTAAHLEHIATLQRLGETQQAQLFLAEKVADHMPKEEKNAGFLADTYKRLRDNASGYADILMSLGKIDSYSDQAKKKLEEIANLRKHGIAETSEAIVMRKAEYAAIMDNYVAEEKLNAAKTDAAAKNEKELAITNEIHKTKSYKITELEDTLKLLASGEQTNLVLEREREIREQIANLKKVKPSEAEKDTTKLLEEAKRQDAATLAAHEDSFTRWIEAWQVTQDKLVALGAKGIAARKAHETAYSVYVAAEYMKRSEAADAAAAKERAAQDKRDAADAAHEQRKQATEDKKIAARLASQNAYFLKVAEAADRSDNRATAREDKRYQAEVAEFERRLALAVSADGFFLGEEEAFQTARDNIQIAHNKNQQQIGLAAFEQQLATAGTQYRLMFEIDKEFKTVQAVMDGYKAIQSAYAWGAGWGGPIGGAAAAAVAFAATAANVAAIRGASFGGGTGMSGAGGGSGGAPLTTPSPLAPALAAQTPALAQNNTPSPAQLVQQVNLTIVGANGNPDAPLLSYNTFVNDVIPIMRQAKNNGHLVDFNIKMA